MSEPPGCNTPDAMFGGIKGGMIGLVVGVVLNPLVNSNPVGWCVGAGIVIGAIAKTQLPRERYRSECRDLPPLRR